MSQQQVFNLPPPPPRSPGSHLPSGFPEARRSVPTQPPAITTNIARSLAVPSQTPTTASTLGPAGGPLAYSPHLYSPNTPNSLNPSPRTLVPSGSQSTSPRTSVMEPYNPRQWTNRQAVSGSQMVFQQQLGSVQTTRDATGMEGML